MVLIAGLIGIGLALEVAERRNANRRNNFHGAQGSHHNSRVKSEDTPAQQDEQAFQEVQNYADFQRVLSERVSDDLMKEEAASPISTFAPATPHDFRHNFSQPAYPDPSLFIPASQSGLPSPVVITQQRSEGGQVAWARTYAPVLWQGGINQDAFFHFIDCYNEIIKNSPRFEVINILAMGVGYYSNISQVLSSQAVPMALSLAKGSQSLEPTSTYLRQANSQLFAPHGLNAMVVTFSHREQQVYTVDNTQSNPNPSALGSESQFMFAAPLVFSDNKSSQESPKRARGSKSETKKALRRPTSRRKGGQKADGLLTNAFEGVAFPSRIRGPRGGGNAANEVMNKPGQSNVSTLSFASGEMDGDALYLLIVNDTPGPIGFMPSSHGIQPPFNNYNYVNRPVLQVDTANRPWVYSPDNKGYSAGTFDTSGHLLPQHNNDPPPSYDFMLKGSYDRTHPDGGEFCVPTL